MTKLKKVEKVYNGKFIKTYLATFQTEQGVKKYEIASRKDVPDILSESPAPDAVRILPYFWDEHGNLQVVLIKEFRYPINSYIYGLCAGLIDKGEDPVKAAKRELMEEIGAKVISLQQTEKCSYSSAGFCDESLICFEAEVKLNGKQKLDKFEDISVLTVNLDTLEKMLDEENFGLQSRLQLRGFVYKQKMIKLIADKKSEIAAKTKSQNENNTKTSQDEKKIGAFVGKFLPPHIGHLSVIDRALDECDEVVVVLADNPEKSKQLCLEAGFPYFDAKKRLKWIKKHYKGRKNIHFYYIDESVLKPYTSQGFADLFWKSVKEKVNVKYGDESYRKLNEEGFGNCKFVAVDRSLIDVSGTKVRNNKENLKFMIEEGKQDVLKAIEKQNKRKVK